MKYPERYRYEGKLEMQRWDVSWVAAEQTLIQLGVDYDDVKRVGIAIADYLYRTPCAEVDYVGKSIRLAFAVVHKSKNRISEVSLEHLLEGGGMSEQSMNELASDEDGWML